MNNENELPDLKENQKYYIVAIDNRWNPSYLGYSTKKDRAIKKLKEEKDVFKHRKDITIEIIPALNMKNLIEIYNKRGKKNYIITGETYENRKNIRNITGSSVKFDYVKKGYRGALSIDQLNDLKKISGLEIKEIAEITEAEKRESEIGRLESKQNKRLRHTKKEGSIWQKDRPFSQEQEQAEYSANWTFRVGKEYRLNDGFNQNVEFKKNQILETLNLKSMEEASQKVQDAYDKYRKQVYEYYLNKVKASHVAPNPYVTGRSNYKGNISKRNSMDKNAYENLVKTTKQVDSIIRLEAEIINKENPIKKIIDFGNRGSILNNKIRDYRKTYKNLEIFQYSSSKRKDGNSKWYIIKNKNTNDKYSMKINENGRFSFGKGTFPTDTTIKHTDSVKMYESIENLLKAISKKEIKLSKRKENISQISLTSFFK